MDLSRLQSPAGPRIPCRPASSLDQQLRAVTTWRKRTSNRTANFYYLRRQYSVCRTLAITTAIHPASPTLKDSTTITAKHNKWLPPFSSVQDLTTSAVGGTNRALRLSLLLLITRHWFWWSEAWLLCRQPLILLRFPSHRPLEHILLTEFRAQGRQSPPLNSCAILALGIE